MSDEPTNDQEMDVEEPKRSQARVPWFAVILIVLGLILLAQQFGDFSFDNWWALFILIPVFSAFASAIAIWRRAGRFTFAVWSAFYGGLFPLLVAVIFLFNLDWEDYWPLFIILGGFGMMMGGLPFKRTGDEKTPRALRCHRGWAIFVGLAGTLLGLTFLAFNLNLIESLTFVGFENWWAVYILIAALGGLVTALCLFLGRHSFLLAVINLAAALLVGFAGAVALYNLDWNLIYYAAAILLILAGIWVLVGVGDKKDQQEPQE